jgi:UDP-N-acetylmuramoyl-tripeptide--D-alanyl-D-alanine ligase
VWADDVAIDDQLRPRFLLRSPWGSVEVQMGARGIHNVANALAAAAVALWCGVSLESAAAGLGNPIDSPWRMELHRSVDGLTVLNDAYNAGPASMAAALRSLATLPAARRVAVLGVMAELGDRAAQEHSRIADLTTELGVELVAVGTDLYGVAPLADAAAAVAAVRHELAMGPTDTAVLVKGSRVAGLEVVAEQLIAD